MTINEFMTNDHRKCDHLFTEMENLVNDGAWDKAGTLFSDFHHAMTRHFDREEKVIFPRFNECAEGGCNPTPVMIMEHDQMRRLLAMMENALKTQNREQLLGLSENLMLLMQQHNMKEEQVMYNLADDALNASEIIPELEKLDA